MPGLQLPPYNNAGLVDPAANALQGLATMYGVADQEANMRDQDLRFLQLQNQYNNSMLDNPVLAADRANKLSEAAVQAKEYAEGRKSELARETNRAGIETAKGQQSQGQMVQEGQRANGILQGQAMLDHYLNSDEGKKAGHLGAQSFWEQRVAPHLKQFNVDLGNDYMKGRLALESAMPAALQTRDFMQKMAMQAPQLQTQRDVAEISAGASRYHTDVQAQIAQIATVDKVMAGALNRVMAENPAAAKALVEAYLIGKTGNFYNQNSALKFVDIQLRNAQTRLQAAQARGDKKEVASIQEEINAIVTAKAQIEQEATGAATLGVGGQSGRPSAAPAAPKPPKNQAPYETINGQKYENKPGYTLKLDPADGKVYYYKDPQ